MTPLSVVLIVAHRVRLRFVADPLKPRSPRVLKAYFGEELYDPTASNVRDLPFESCRILFQVLRYLGCPAANDFSCRPSKLKCTLPLQARLRVVKHIIRLYYEHSSFVTFQLFDIYERGDPTGGRG